MTRFRSCVYKGNLRVLVKLPPLVLGYIGKFLTLQGAKSILIKKSLIFKSTLNISIFIQEIKSVFQNSKLIIVGVLWNVHTCNSFEHAKRILDIFPLHQLARVKVSPVIKIW